MGSCPRGWVGIASAAAVRLSELVDEAGLDDGISSGVLDMTAYAIASIRTFAPQEANWFDNFRASSALQPRYMR